MGSALCGNRLEISTLFGNRLELFIVFFTRGKIPPDIAEALVPGAGLGVAEVFHPSRQSDSVASSFGVPTVHVEGPLVDDPLKVLYTASTFTDRMRAWTIRKNNVPTPVQPELSQAVCAHGPSGGTMCQHQCSASTYQVAAGLYIPSREFVSL